MKLLELFGTSQKIIVPKSEAKKKYTNIRDWTVSKLNRYERVSKVSISQKWLHHRIDEIFALCIGWGSECIHDNSHRKWWTFDYFVEWNKKPRLDWIIDQ